MTWFLALFLTTTLFANSFDLKETANRFSLVINSRVLTYTSEKKRIDGEIKPCNLPLVRALNSELLSQVPFKEEPKGLPFLVDGNTYHVAANGKEAKVLLSMDQRMIRYQLEEKKACSK
jgi:hypothetical protein